MKRFFFPAAIIVILLASQCLAQDVTYQHTITVEQMTFQWTLNSDSMQVKLSGKTTGWVGVGFNPTKAMKDAKFIIGYVKNGEPKIQQQYGNSEFSHTKDAMSGKKEEITNISGSEANGMTELAFTIPLSPGNIYGQAIKINQDMTILLAFGPGMDSFLTKHQFRKTLKVNLSTGSNQNM
ncbi:MAG: DOMON domain-containing protein [Desulfosalsimonadaceae bacterium]